MLYDIQNEEDEPKLPDNFDGLSQGKQIWEKKLLRRRLVHFTTSSAQRCTTGSTTKVWYIRSVISVAASAIQRIAKR